MLARLVREDDYGVPAIVQFWLWRESIRSFDIHLFDGRVITITEEEIIYRGLSGVSLRDTGKIRENWLIGVLDQEISYAVRRRYESGELRPTAREMHAIIDPERTYEPPHILSAVPRRRINLRREE